MWTTTAKADSWRCHAWRILNYIQSCILSGGNSFHIIMKHLLPNCMSTLIVVFLPWVFQVQFFLRATLSFLGLGVQPPDWGQMIAASQPYLASQPLYSIAPGIVIIITVMSFNFIGDTLRDALIQRCVLRKELRLWQKNRCSCTEADQTKRLKDVSFRHVIEGPNGQSVQFAVLRSANLHKGTPAQRRKSSARKTFFSTSIILMCALYWRWRTSCSKWPLVYYARKGETLAVVGSLAAGRVHDSSVCYGFAFASCTNYRRRN